LPQLEAAESVDGAKRREAVAAVVSELHQESAFQPDENGELAVALDREEVKAAALRVLGD